MNGPAGQAILYTAVLAAVLAVYGCAEAWWAACRHWQSPPGVCKCGHSRPAHDQQYNARLNCTQCACKAYTRWRSRHTEQALAVAATPKAPPRPVPSPPAAAANPIVMTITFVKCGCKFVRNYELRTHERVPCEAHVFDVAAWNERLAQS